MKKDINMKAPAVTVRAINQKYLEQLYHSRGELSDTPDLVTEDEEIVGRVITGAGIVVRNKTTNALRMMWCHRWLVGIGLGDVSGKQAERQAAYAALPQLFVD